MGSINQSSVFNLPQEGGLGFCPPQSDLQFNWRNNPGVVSCREFVTNAIQVYLAQNTYGEFGQEFAELVAYLENQLFMNALSEEDYMDQENFYDRLQMFIKRKWFEAESAKQEGMPATTSLPIYPFARTFGMLNSNPCANFNKLLPDYTMSANAESNLVCAPYLLADLPRSTLYGSQKQVLNANLRHPKQVLPNNCSPVGGFSSAEPADSGPTFSGSVLQYDSEASFESHCKESQHFTKEAPIVSDEVNLQQPVLEPPHFEQLSQPKYWGDEHCQGKVQFSSCLSVQNRNSYASQCAKPGTLSFSYYDGSGQYSTSSYVQQGAAEKLLCGYIIYNRNPVIREGREIPFLEYAHLQKCNGGVCNCEKFKKLCSHFDSCGSADCGICGPAVRICSEGMIQLGLRNSRNGYQGMTCGSNCGKRVCPDTSGDFMNPAKSRKLNPSSPRNGSSYDISALTESISPSGPVDFGQQSVFPVTVTLDKPEAKVQMITSQIDDATRTIEAGNLNLDDIHGSNSDDATNPSEDPSADFCQKTEMIRNCTDDATRISEASKSFLDDVQGSNSSDVTSLSEDPPADFQRKEIEPAVPYELKDMVTDSLCEDKCTAQNEDFITEETETKISGEGLPLTTASFNGMKSEKQKVDGISLIDFFTPEEIRLHMSSLWKKIDQGIAEEVIGNTANCSLSENFCQLCAIDRLAFPPMPTYCSSCGARIKNLGTYYSTTDENRTQLCFCTTCYNKCRGGNITLYGLSISKSNLVMKKNNLVTEESWVQCDKCEGWQHQICALFNDKRDLGDKSEYVCPKCFLDDLETEGCKPLPRCVSFDASNLPQTLLSDHLERRLFRLLNQEREDRATAAGKSPEEVPQPADLVVRVVSSVDKRLKVKQQFLEIFPEKNYPEEFPYRSKVILLFQRIEGVDVCLFAMYVQEFGSECSRPNQRCVYISYLDSVKYFRPEMKTVKGEALRTFVYHEILVGYLDYCKKRGFATCYIWACPPVKGEDYILYCHPETQKTPRPDKLRQWYQSMLKKATEEKIVVNFTNLYEKFFVPTGECNTKVTAARLPYFDGDYWSSVAESMIKKIELESGGDPQKQVKKMTRRSLKAMGHINPSADDAKDILLMQALAQNISSAKDDFIIVYLQFVCSHCHEVILSGKRWFCNQCKNYQLCERCHDADQHTGPGNTHISSSGQRHALSQEMVNDVPVDTEDNDVIMDNCFLENRHAFLSFCQGNHYQFDSLRRAKHSSMMILYHLHNPIGSDSGTFCSLCLKNIGADSRWICEICPEFSVCSSCYPRNNTSCHTHTLISHLPAAIGGTDSKTDGNNGMVKELLGVILHASRCQITDTISNPCSYPNCTLIKRLFFHAHACNIRVAGGCRHCKKVWFILMIHSRRCKDMNCSIPRCTDLKNHTEGRELESKTQQRTELPDVCRQSAL